MILKDVNGCGTIPKMIKLEMTNNCPNPGVMGRS